MTISDVLGPWTMIGHLDLGTFAIGGDRVRIADPCYLADRGAETASVNPDDFHIAATLPILPGHYRATALVGHHPAWDRRVLDLFIEPADRDDRKPPDRQNVLTILNEHDDVVHDAPRRTQRAFSDVTLIGNDTGRIVVIDVNALPAHADEIEAFAQSIDTNAPIADYRGVVIDSGLGDGEYQLRAAYDERGQIVALHLLFLDEAQAELGETFAERWFGYKRGNA